MLVSGSGWNSERSYWYISYYIPTFYIIRLGDEFEIFEDFILVPTYVEYGGSILDTLQYYIKFKVPAAQQTLHWILFFDMYRVSD